MPRKYRPILDPDPAPLREVVALLSVVHDPRDRLAILLAARMGLRCSEVAAVNHRDIYYEADRLSVRQGKGSKDRSVPLDEEVRRIIESFGHPPEYRGALILNRRGERITRNGLYRMLQTYLKKAGIEHKFGFHALRIRYATSYIEAGGKGEDLQRILGHSKITTTMRYVRFSKPPPAVKLGY